jgi:hypothetical protein
MLARQALGDFTAARHHKYEDWVRVLALAQEGEIILQGETKIMKKLRLLAILIVAVAILASCTTFKASGLSYSLKDQKTTVLGDFKTEVWVNKFLGASGGSTLFNLTANATDSPLMDAIQKAIRDKNGDAAINVTIEHQASFVDIILNAVTSYIYAPSLVIVSGTIIKYE